MRDPASELRRILLLGTSVNKAASVSVYTGGHLFGARERKNEIVGTVAKPRKGTLWRMILRPG